MHLSVEWYDADNTMLRSSDVIIISRRSQMRYNHSICRQQDGSDQMTCYDVVNDVTHLPLPSSHPLNHIPDGACARSRLVFRLRHNMSGLSLL